MKAAKKHKKQKLWSFSLLCLLMAVGAPAGVAQEASIDRVVKQRMSANKIPGVSLAVLREGKIVLLKSYGLANVEHQVPVKPETVFQSNSRFLQPMLLYPTLRKSLLPRCQTENGYPVLSLCWSV